MPPRTFGESLNMEDAFSLNLRMPPPNPYNSNLGVSLNDVGNLFSHFTPNDTEKICLFWSLYLFI